MPSKTNTVVLTTPNGSYKICKLWFGADGSYYVTSPYHPAEKAILWKFTVNYALDEQHLAFEEAVETGSVDDDDHHLKLTHHASGFIQFSGPGIVSGLNPDGSIRGMGVRSWPLTKPMRGPAFGMRLRGVEQFAPAKKVSDNAITFNETDLTFLPEPRSIILEGHYLPPLWRRFIRTVGGEKMISVLHPCRAVLALKVVLPPADCILQGFIGLELYTVPADENVEPIPNFTFSSATGNVRQNSKGEIIADGLYCFYPRGDIPASRNLNFAMNEIPPDGVVR